MKRRQLVNTNTNARSKSYVDTNGSTRPTQKLQRVVSMKRENKKLQARRMSRDTTVRSVNSLDQVTEDFVEVRGNSIEEFNAGENTSRGRNEIDNSLLSSITGFLIENLQPDHPHEDDLSPEHSTTETFYRDQKSIQVNISSTGLQNNTIEQNSNITGGFVGDPFEKIADDGNDENYEDAPPYWESTETFDRGIYGIETEVILDDEKDEEDSQTIDDVPEVPLGRKALRRRRAKRSRT